jgi:hypothetical protein
MSYAQLEHIFVCGIVMHISNLTFELCALFNNVAQDLVRGRDISNFEVYCPEAVVLSPWENYKVSIFKSPN